MRALTVIWSVLILTGCAATGPTSSPGYTALIEAALPAEAGPLVMFGPGNWCPNTIGFTDVRSTAGYGATAPVSSAIVVGQRAVVVEQWDDRTKTFNVMKLIKLSDISEANIDTFFSGATRLVLRSADYSYNSFDFSDGAFLDNVKAKAFASYLQQHIGVRR